MLLYIYIYIYIKRQSKIKPGINIIVKKSHIRHIRTFTAIWSIYKTHQKPIDLESPHELSRTITYNNQTQQDSPFQPLHTWSNQAKNWLVQHSCTSCLFMLLEWQLMTQRDFIEETQHLALQLKHPNCIPSSFGFCLCINTRKFRNLIW